MSVLVVVPIVWTLVAFLVVYFATVFGYSEHRANALANWYWIANALGLLAAGLLSDRLRVRKPLMIAGTALSLIAAAIFASRATHADTSYHTFAWVFVLGAVGGGTAYVAWMSAFTETVEKVNPAATATLRCPGRVSTMKCPSGEFTNMQVLKPAGAPIGLAR